MQAQGQVGPIATTASIAPGTAAPLRQGNMQDLIVSEAHGRYYEAAYRGTKFHAANQVAATTTATLAAGAITGLILSNPQGSGVNVVINKVGYAFLVAFAAASAVGLAVGYSAATAVTHTTALTPASDLVGTGPSGKATVDAASTTPTAATIDTIFATGLTGAITTTPGLQGLIDFEGGKILPPGAFAFIYTSTASGASAFLGSFDWEEVPV